MRKAGIFLCGIIVAGLLAGCGSTMPDLTQEETDLISEYAVGILLKYDKNHGSRLVDTSEYENVVEEAPSEIPEVEPEQEQEPEITENDAEVVDVSQDTETASLPSTIEEYYGIEGVTFQYLGYDLTDSYPPGADGEDIFFAMDATEGSQLLVLRFMATNVTSSDLMLNMMDYGVKFRISVNGEAGQSALTTMLLDDLQTYKDILPAGYSVELVSIVEIPQSSSVETIDFILRGGDENATMSLQ